MKLWLAYRLLSDGVAPEYHLERARGPELYDFPRLCGTDDSLQSVPGSVGGTAVEVLEALAGLERLGEGVVKVCEECRREAEKLRDAVTQLGELA